MTVSTYGNMLKLEKSFKKHCKYSIVNGETVNKASFLKPQDTAL